MAFLVGWDGRPQEFGAQLALGEIDVAIAGDDWIRERTLEFKYEYKSNIALQKVLLLNRGGVRIVAITKPLAAARSADEWFRDLFSSRALVTVASELPYLTVEWVLAKAEKLQLGLSPGAFSVQKFKTPPRISAGLVVYETWGKTEAKVIQGAVDFGVEIVQTGGAIRNYGLHILEEIMQSSAGIWVNPAIKDNPVKYDLARMFVLNLYGAIFAEDKVLLVFNAKKADMPQLLAYLRNNKLFADEPTLNEGVRFTEISVQMMVANPELPLAKARYELAKLGATHIDTIPLESSIPGLDVIEF
jgi:ATP phosphoribosyltransferase